MKGKIRNPQDSTLRNVRAAHKAVAHVRAIVDGLVILMANQAERIAALEKSAQHAPSEPEGPKRKRR